MYVCKYTLYKPVAVVVLVEGREIIISFSIVTKNGISYAIFYCRL